MVERHDVGDGPEGDEIEVARRHFRRTGNTPVLQHAADPGHQVERDPDAGEALAGERTLRQVRVHDDGRVGQRIAGQMMIGDEHRNAEPVCLRDPVEARYAIIDRDQERWAALRRNAHDFRGQAVAVFETIRHEVVDFRETELAQAAQYQRRARRTIDVEVTNDDDAAIPVRDHEFRRFVDIVEPAHRCESRKAVIELCCLGQATHGEQARVQWIDVTEGRDGIRGRHRSGQYRSGVGRHQSSNSLSRRQNLSTCERRTSARRPSRNNNTSRLTRPARSKSRNSSR